MNEKIWTYEIYLPEAVGNEIRGSDQYDVTVYKD